MVHPTEFEAEKLYTRAEVADRIGMPAERQGGNWSTGYDKWNDEFFIFCNVGTAGRTGHDYPNRWEGDELVWFGKSRTRLGQPQISTLVSNELPVHVFWRETDRASFRYAGVGTAVEVADSMPVRVRWIFKPS